MDHDVAAATAAQRPGCLGMALRRRALAQEGEEAIATLQEAVEAFEGTDLRLELGWALHDLGRGSAAIAAPPANRCAGRSTSGTARSPRCWPAMRTASSRPRRPPRRERLDGVEALTPAERRVAQLAAEGLTNRQIAETLWVTLKTVEVHLGRSYGKLGIGGRGELVVALGLEDGARAA